MQRRHALQHLLRGFAAGGLVGPAALYGQGQCAVQPGVVQTGQPAAAAPAQRPQAAFQPTEEVQDIPAGGNITRSRSSV